MQPTRAASDQAARHDGGSLPRPRMPAFAAKLVSYRLTWLAASAALILLTLLKMSTQPLNGDVGVLLATAERILDGALMYRDILETNPPLVFYLAIPPIYLARLLGRSPVPFFYAYLMVWAIVALWLCRELLSLMPKANRWLVRITLLFLTAVCVPFSYPHLGQREHFVVLGFLPYLLLTAARAARVKVPTPLIVAAGLGAAIAFAIKPFFLIVWALFVGYLWLTIGWRSTLRTTENGLIGSFQVLYAAVVLATFPQFLPLARLILPLYKELNTGYRELLVEPENFAIPFLAAWVLFARPTQPYRALLHLSTLAAVGFYFCVLIQKKGFTYHFLMADLSLVFILFFFFLDLFNRPETMRRLTRLRRPGMAALGALVLLMLTVHRLSVPVSFPGFPGLRPVVQEYAAGKPLVVLDTSLWTAFPLMYQTGARWTSPFNCMWLVPAVYPKRPSLPVGYHTRDQMSAAERYLVDGVVDDFVKNRPALVLVNDGPGRWAMGHIPWFDFLEYFLRDPRFARAFQQYEQVPTPFGFRGYRLRENRSASIR